MKPGLLTDGPCVVRPGRGLVISRLSISTTKPHGASLVMDRAWTCNPRAVSFSCGKIHQIHQHKTQHSRQTKQTNKQTKQTTPNNTNKRNTTTQPTKQNKEPNQAKPHQTNETKPKQHKPQHNKTQQNTRQDNTTMLRNYKSFCSFEAKLQNHFVVLL